MVQCTIALIASKPLYICFLSKCTNEVRSGRICFQLVQPRRLTRKKRAQFSSVSKGQEEIGYHLSQCQADGARILITITNDPKDRSFQNHFLRHVLRHSPNTDFPSYWCLMNDQKSYLQVP